MGSQFGRSSAARMLGVFAVVICGLSVSAHAAEQVYKLGHMFARNSLPDKAANKFAELLAERSKGAIKLEIHPEGLLGDERENLAQLRKGILQFAVTGDVVVSNIGDRYRVVNMPFLYRDSQHALRTYDGDLGKIIRGNMRAEGVETLSWHYVGTRMLTANKPIRNLADIKGLNLRLPQDSAWITTWRALGANTKHVPFPELADALRLGSVDAQENPPNFIRANRLYEQQKYLITSNHMPQRQMIFASEILWSKLKDDKRELIRAAAREASAWLTMTAEKEQAADMQWLVREGGLSLIQFDPAGVPQAIASVPAVLAGKEGNEIFREIVAIR
jgi:tripartite ATP-independent transporter DctP family solute receptor